MRSLLVALLLALASAHAQDAVVNAAPPIPEAPTYADRQAWHAFLDWPQRYEDTFLATHGTPAPDDDGYLRFDALEPDWYLITVQTFLGAYQPGQIFFAYNSRWQEGFLLSLPFVLVDEARGDRYQLGAAIEVAGLATFDPVRHELELFSRARGAGGCGRLSRYRFAQEVAFLVESRAQSCQAADAQGEAMVLEPHQWPQVWPPTEPSP